MPAGRSCEGWGVHGQKQRKVALSGFLAASFLAGIQRKYDEDRELGDRLVIHIVSDSALDQDRVRRNFHNYLDDESRILTKQQHVTRLKHARLFLIGIYFADVYDTFYRVGLKKNIFEDVDNDFIHHPTEWGHKLYLTSLMPVFNIKGDLCPKDIRNYVYIDQ